MKLPDLPPPTADSPGRQRPLRGRAITVSVPRALLLHPESTCAAVAAYASIAEAIISSDQRERGAASNAEVLAASPWAKWASVERQRRWLAENGFITYEPGTGHSPTIYQLYDETAAELDRELENISPDDGERTPWTPYYKVPRTLLAEDGVRAPHICLFASIYSVIDWGSLKGYASVSHVQRISHLNAPHSFRAVRRWLADRGYVAWEAGMGHQPTAWALTIPTPTGTHMGVPSNLPGSTMGDPQKVPRSRNGDPKNLPGSPEGDPQNREALGRGTPGLRGLDVGGPDDPAQGTLDPRPPGPPQARPQGALETRAISVVEHLIQTHQDDDDFSIESNLHTELAERCRRIGIWDDFEPGVQHVAGNLAASYGIDVTVEAMSRVWQKRRVGGQRISNVGAYLAEVAKNISSGSASSGDVGAVVDHLMKLASEPGADLPEPVWASSLHARWPELDKVRSWLLSPTGRWATTEERIRRVNEAISSLGGAAEGAYGPVAEEETSRSCEHRNWSVLDGPDGQEIRICANPDCRAELEEETTVSGPIEDGTVDSVG